MRLDGDEEIVDAFTGGLLAEKQLLAELEFSAGRKFVAVVEPSADLDVVRLRGRVQGGERGGGAASEQDDEQFECLLGVETFVFHVASEIVVPFVRVFCRQSVEGRRNQRSVARNRRACRCAGVGAVEHGVSRRTIG